MASHYIVAFTERNGRMQRAACGAWVRQDEHSAEPTCLDCQDFLVRDATLDAEMEALADAPSDPVTNFDFDPITGREWRRPR